MAFLAFGGFGVRLNPRNVATELEANTTRQAGHDKRTYFAVIALLGFAMNSLPSFFFQQFIFVNPFYQPDFFGSPLASWIALVIFPLIFFGIFYFYGKRSILNFNESYLTVVPVLFFSAVLGDAVFVLSAPFISPLANFSGNFALTDAYTSLDQVFTGIAGLALAYLRAGGIQLSKSLP